MLPASTHHVEDHSEEVTAAVAVDKGAKSVIAGKKSDSSGQTTATGGLLQSRPCAQPSKSMRLQEKEKKKCHTEAVQTGNLVYPQHDACCCGPALLVQSLFHAESNPLQLESPFSQLAPRAVTVCTLGSESVKEQAVEQKDQLGSEQQLCFFLGFLFAFFNQAQTVPKAAPGITMRQMSFLSQQQSHCISTVAAWTANLSLITSAKLKSH